MIKRVNASGWQGLHSSDGDCILWNIDYSHSTRYPVLNGQYLVVTKEFITVAEVCDFAGGMQGVSFPGSVDTLSVRAVKDKYPDALWLHIPLPKNPPYKVDMKDNKTPVVSRMIR